MDSLRVLEARNLDSEGRPALSEDSWAEAFLCSVCSLLPVFSLSTFYKKDSLGYALQSHTGGFPPLGTGIPMHRIKTEIHSINCALLGHTVALICYSHSRVGPQPSLMSAGSLSLLCSALPLPHSFIHSGSLGGVPCEWGFFLGFHE